MVGLIDLFNVGLFINRHEIDTENAEKVKSAVFRSCQKNFFLSFNFCYSNRKLKLEVKNQKNKLTLPNPHPDT
jgi:hypothetical protein